MALAALAIVSIVLKTVMHLCPHMPASAESNTVYNIIVELRS
jgi:hypothetical protein